MKPSNFQVCFGPVRFLRCLPIVFALFAYFGLSLATAQTVVNGDFEGGLSNWTASGSFFSRNNSARSHRGSRYAYFGVASDGVTALANATGSIEQSITIPSGASSASLTYWVWVGSDEGTTTAFDFLYVDVLNSSGGLLSTVVTNSNRDKSGSFASTTPAYQFRRASLGAYAGSTIRIRFRGSVDGDLSTIFRLDDVNVTAVTVTSPNDGENWTAGTTHSITWTVLGNANKIDYYKVALSTDGGATYSTDLTPDGIFVPSTRSFDWAIPSSLDTTRARIRVRPLYVDGSDGYVLSEDASDANFTVSQPVAVPTVQTLAATSVGANSATLNGEIVSDGGGSILERRIEWTKSTGDWGTGVSGIDYGFFSDATTPFSLSDNTFSLSLVGFASNTGYKYRVWVRNSAGWSDVNVVNVVTFTTSQSCTFSLSSSGASHGFGSDSGSFDVFAGSGCIWTATTTDGWIHTSSSGSGNGTVSYTIDATANARSGTITVGGQTFTINQAGPDSAPDARFAIENKTPQPGQSVRCYAVAPVAGNTFSWFIDNNPITAGPDSSAYLTFTSSGTHRVKLVASDSQSRSHTQSADVNVQSNVSGTGGAGSSGNTRPVYGADPVNLASGNYTYEHTDLRFPGVGIPFEFSRFYNSKFNDQSGLPLGYGWSYSPSIRVTEDAAKAVVTFGDGHAETFTRTGDNYVGDAGVFDLLVKNLADNTWLVITKQQTTNHLNADGRLVLIRDRNGNTITLDYETDPAANGRLKQIVDTAGRTTFFRGYPGIPSLIGSIEDVLQRTNSFYYDDTTTNLIAMVDARGNTNRFYYDAKHQLTALKDNRDHVIVSNIYDPDLNVVISQEDAYGQRVSFVYDFTNHITIQTNALNQPSTYQFDDRLLLTNRVDEAGFPESYAYDATRNRILVRDRNGNETHYEYDERGNVTNKVDALTNVTSIEYDERNNPIRRVDALLNLTSFVYDERGNLTDTTNALLHVSHVRYDHGLPIVLTDPRGFSTTNQFDSAGNLVAVIDAKGNTNRFEYDEAGRKLRQIDVLNRTNSFFYDPNNNLTATVNALGQTNSATFDENNNRTSTVDPRGAVTTNQFDFKDRLYLVTDALLGTNFVAFDALDRKTASIDPGGNPTGYELNPIGYLLSVTNALTQVTRFTHDPNGNQTSVTDATGNSTTNWFDQLNRRYATVDPLNHTNHTGFDQLGRIIATTNANGQVTQFLYDAIGRLTNVVDAANGNVFFDYDENGNRTRVTAPNGHSWTNHFDELNRLVEQDDPLGSKVLLYYDAVGNLTNRVTANGAAITYQPDALNRITNIVYPDATFVTFAFDEAGNRTNMVDHVNTTVWTFDLLRRLTSCTDPFGNTVSNRFDQAGNRTALRYPDGKEVLYGYDALNRMESLTNWLGGEVHYLFDNRGVLTNTVNANGTKVDMGYDSAGRMTSVANWSPTATLIASEAVQLDPVGNQTLLTGLKPLVPILQNTNVSYLYDADNRLTHFNGKAVTHDKDGNLTVLGMDSYRYDFEDRLLSYAAAGTFGGQHLYDGLGNRLQHTTNGVSRRFVLDRLSALTQVLTEANGAGPVTAYYVYGLGLAQRITQDNKAATYHFDLRGSTVALTSDTGEQVAAYAYDAFGVLAESDEDRPQPFRYLGRYGILDDGNGLCHARRRYFSPSLGRFISKDPLGGKDSSSQSFNRYVYALNNPLRFRDTTGFVATEGNRQVSQDRVIVPEQAEVLMSPQDARDWARLLKQHATISQAPVLTPEEQRRSDALTKGYLETSDFVSRAIDRIVLFGLAAIPQVGVPIAAVSGIVADQSRWPETRDNIASALTDHKLHTESGRAFLRSVGEGRVLAFRIENLISDVEDGMERLGVPPVLIDLILDAK